MRVAHLILTLGALAVVGWTLRHVDALTRAIAEVLPR